MDLVYEQKLIIGPSSTDADRLLSHHAAFNLLQDTAAIHAARLGIGLNALEQRSLYWVIVKIKTVFERRPGLGEKVVLRTWPEKPGALRCNRSYEIRRGEELLIRGRTEWAVMNTATHALTPAAGLFPAELPFDRPPACAEPFARIPDKFEGVAPFDTYRVRSTDIDVGGHMNNAAYLRALFGAFSNRELQALRPQTVDVSFRASCFEGEELCFFRRETENGPDLRIARGADTILLARMA